MGPYMRPIPTGASAAMLFSLAVAFIVSPWAAYRVFRGTARRGGRRLPEGLQTRVYRRAMGALVARRRRALGVLRRRSSSCWRGPWGSSRRRRKVKMLPFDNKSEFQVLIDDERARRSR